MLRELLITVLVAGIVIVVARIKRARSVARGQQPQQRVEEEAWYRSSTAIVGFIFAGIVILSTAGVTWFRYQHANEILRVEVVDPASGSRTVYQVRRKHLGDREFRTVDGRRISLGSGDRVERVD